MQVGRFLLRRKLTRDDHPGKAVWLAYDEQMGREVVLKEVDGAGEPRALAKISHAHVITVYEYLSVDTDAWAVMEYAPGGSLAGQRIAPEPAARIGAQIAGALGYMHAKGLVHCDVKPGNIVVAADGVAKLTDFGSAYRVGATITRQDQISYTPAYAPPEVIKGNPVPASDVYSLGATLHALVVGAPPGSGPSPNLGPLGEVLAAMLRQKSVDRPTAAEACRLLQAAADGVGPTARTADEATIPPVALATDRPAQLPGDVFGFAGRGTELDRLDDLLAERATAVVISAISGTAGVGKTALALHWAHRVADRFPDGQLYVNLRGFDLSGQTVDPAAAVRGFLYGLGVSPDRIPANRDAQTALYRSLLASRRMLVVLDNARDTEQVRDLVPGGPGCLAVVTSRNDLVGLIAKEGARPLSLDVLTDADARQLLEHRIGRDRTAVEPGAVDEIITACANLPLALAIVAARAAIRPALPLSVLLSELDVLTGDSPDTDVRTVFSWSYDQLSTGAARLFRLLGVHRGPDISAPAAASLAGIPREDVRPLLVELTRAHLVAEHEPGRYAWHDLLRTYAAELVRTDEEREEATRRLLDHYVTMAFAVKDLLYPHDDPDARAVRPGAAPESLIDYQDAMDWCTTEHSVLLAAVDFATETGFDDHVCKLGKWLQPYFDLQAHWHDLAAVQRAALSAAQRLGDRAARARAHQDLAGAYYRLGRFDDAIEHVRQALDLFTELGNRSGAAHVHIWAGEVLSHRDDRQALDHAQQALDLYRITGNRAGEAIALGNMGWYRCKLGEYQQAIACSEPALELAREIGDRGEEGAAWENLGHAHHHLGNPEYALTCYHHALDLYRQIGDRYYETTALTALGDVLVATGDRDTARDSWQQALAILEELQHADAEVVRAKLRRSPPERPE